MYAFHFIHSCYFATNIRDLLFCVKSVDKDESLIENEIILNDKNWVKDEINLKSVCLSYFYMLSILAIILRNYIDAIILRNSIFPGLKHSKATFNRNIKIHFGLITLVLSHLILKNVLP